MQIANILFPDLEKKRERHRSASFHTGNQFCTDECSPVVHSSDAFTSCRGGQMGTGVNSPDQSDRINPTGHEISWQSSSGLESERCPPRKTKTNTSQSHPIRRRIINSLFPAQIQIQQRKLNVQILNRLKIDSVLTKPTPFFSTIQSNQICFQLLPVTKKISTTKLSAICFLLAEKAEKAQFFMAVWSMFTTRGYNLKMSWAADMKRGLNIYHWKNSRTDFYTWFFFNKLLPLNPGG